MRFSVGVPTCKEGLSFPLPFADASEVIRIIQAAERFGYHSVWGNDHITAPRYIRQSFDQPPRFYEPLIMLSYAAAVTSRILLAPSVIVLPMREPVYLAKQAATLDQVSGGRFILGVGVGAYREEFEAIRPDLKGANRGEMVDESIEALHRLLTQPVASFKGKYFHFEDIELFPKPAQDPFPIYVGGNNVNAARRAGRYGQGWLPASLGLEDLRRGLDALSREAEASGRDPSTIDIAPQVITIIGRDGADARRRFQSSQMYKHLVSLGSSTLREQAIERFEEYNLVGGAQQIVDKVGRMAQAGVTHCSAMNFVTESPDRMIEQMQQFAEEVMSVFPEGLTCRERLMAERTINLGLGVLQDYTPDRLVEMVRWVESLGYDQLWYANERFFRDMYVGLTLCAVNTQRLRLGTFVAEPYAMHPALIAVAIASLDEVAGGRAMLCLGAGGSGAVPLGIPRVKPARAIGEAIQIIRAALSGERVSFAGELFQFRGGKLNFAPRADIPIYVASRGDLVLSKAGELADGVMIATFATPAGLRHGLARVARGAEQAGRSIDQLALFSRVDACIDEDPRRAKDAVRPMVARLLTSSYPDRSFVHAVGLEVPPDFEAIAAQRNRQLATDSAHLVPDSLVDAFTWAGTAEQVAEQVAAVVDTGFRDITFLPHAVDGHAVEPTIRAFAEQVRPRVEALLKG